MAIQRFGGALNLNVHFHALYTDGSFYARSDGKVILLETGPPTVAELEAQVNCVVLARTKKVLEAAAAALQAAGVTTALNVRKDEFESVPFRWLHSILRLAKARGGREQLRRACKAFYNIEGLDLRVEQVVASAAVTGGDLLRAWFEETLAKELSDLSREFLVQLRTRIVARLDFQAWLLRPRSRQALLGLSHHPPGPDETSRATSR